MAERNRDCFKSGVLDGLQIYRFKFHREIVNAKYRIELTLVVPAFIEGALFNPDCTL
jgi:hypothetical protein